MAFTWQGSMRACAPLRRRSRAKACRYWRYFFSARVEPIAVGLEANWPADLDQVQARCVHLDEVHVALGLQLDLDSSRRSKPVHAPHRAAESGAVGRNRHIIGADEQACMSVREPLWVEREPTPAERDAAGFDDDGKNNRFADELVHEGGSRPLVDLARCSDLLDPALV